MFGRIRNIPTAWFRRKPPSSQSASPGSQTHKPTSLWEAIRRSFLTGIATVFPIFITIYVVAFAIDYLDGLLGGPINAFLRQRFGFAIPGLGLFVAVAAIVAAGFLSRHWIGKVLFPWIDRWLQRLPIFASIYPSAKQLSDFLLGRNKTMEFKQVVLVQYPEKGSYSLGFVTNRGMTEFDQKAGTDLVCVFVPFAPVPFSGLILLLTQDKVVPVEMPVDDAIKFIVSGGVIKPGEHIKKQASGNSSPAQEHQLPPAGT